jgi:hypothetical protein
MICFLPLHALIFRAELFTPEDGGSMFLRNVDVYMQVRTALQARRPRMDIFTEMRNSNLTVKYKNKNLWKLSINKRQGPVHLSSHF